MKIRSMNKPGFKVETVSLLYYKNTSLEKRCRPALCRVRPGVPRRREHIIILSDRGVDENHVAIPSLLAVSAIEQYFDPHQEAHRRLDHPRERLSRVTCTISRRFSATARERYIRISRTSASPSSSSSGQLDKDVYTAINDYNSAILHGIVKIASKMGISTLQSYQSAQIFEAVGICKEVVDKYFTNTVSPVERNRARGDRRGRRVEAQPRL